MIYLQNFKEKYKDRTKDELIEELWKSYNEKEKLERQLKKYKNPHTPSSKQGFDKPQAQGLPVGRKPGKVYNHERTTRPKDTPNTPPIMVTTNVNLSNGNYNIIETGYYIERMITDIKIEKIVTKYTLIEYKDLDTEELFFAKHPDIPEKGIFGKNIIALANSLHFEYRVTLAGVADIFTNVAGIPMTSPTVLELCNRAVDKVEPTYQGINLKLKGSSVVNADETGSNQNGKPEWLWGFFTPFLAFFVFHKQRGLAILCKIS